MAIQFDGQVRYVGGADQGEVDHGDSAKANLKQAGSHLRLATLDKTMDAIRMYSHGAALRQMEDMGYEVDESPALLALKGIAMFPVGVVRDAVELAVHPLLALKDAADAAFHGIAMLFARSDA